MALTSIKASTQDAGAGTPVALAVNEDAAGNALQGMVPLGNKSTWGETARTGLTANDTATTDLTTTGFAGASGANLLDLGNALSVQVRAASDTASKTLTGRVIFYTSANLPIGFSPTLSFTSDASLTLAASGQKYPCVVQIIDVGAARKCRFYVDTIAGTTWDVDLTPI